MHKKLYRSRTDRMLMGVCGGVARYFDVDATLVRLATVILVLLTNLAGIIVYVICGLVIPLEPAMGEAGAGEQPPTSMPELEGARQSAEDITSQAMSDLQTPSDDER